MNIDFSQLYPPENNVLISIFNELLVAYELGLNAIDQW